MFKLSINHHIRNLIILVLCLFILFGSQEISLAQPALDEPLPAGESGIEGGSSVGINGATCNYEYIYQAVADANPGDTIYLSGLIIHSERISAIDKNLTLVAANSDCTAESTFMVTVDATGTSAGLGGVVAIQKPGPDPVSVTFRNLNLISGSATTGGVIYAEPGTTITLDHTFVMFGTASEGGGIFSDGTVEVINGSSIFGNVSTGNGGGVYMNGGELNLRDSSNMYDNRAWNAGGGIYAVSGAVVNLYEGTIVGHSNDLYGNKATASGGGLLLSGSSITMEGAQVLNNEAGAAGGGLALTNTSTLNMVDSEIRGNEAGTIGGGISSGGGTQMIVIQDSIINENSAVIAGGGVFNQSGSINIQDTNETTEFIDNTAGPAVGGGYGGAIYHESSGTLEMYTMGDPSRILIDGNIAYGNGGGIYITYGALDLHGNIQITNNEAGLFGGGICIIDTGDHRIRDKSGDRPLIKWNTAALYGGGIYLEDVDENSGILPGALLDHVDIVGNASYNSGGGIYVTKNTSPGSTITLASIRVMDNIAYYHGGGIAAANSTTLRIYPNSPAAPFSAMGVGPTICDPATLPADEYCSMIHNNQAGTAGLGGFGGGVYLENNSILEIRSASFGSNDADEGGAIYSSVGFNHHFLYNNLFHDNTGGPVIRVDGSGNLVMTNNTMADNPATAVSFSGTASQFNNNIIWDNAYGVDILSGTPSGGCNDFQSSLGLPDDISADPQFVRVWRGDYHLGVNSPAVDACSTGASVDLDGVDRPYGVDFDMGAFEYVPLNIYLPLTSRD